MRRWPRYESDRWALTCAGCLIGGFALGFFGSMFDWPWGKWGFAREPVAETAGPPRAWQPKPGEALHVGPVSALVHSELIADAADGTRLALVIWIRGPRTGREPIRVSGCGGIGGTVESLDPPRRREPWSAAGRGIVDLIALAACHGINPSPTPAPVAHHLES